MTSYCLGAPGPWDVHKPGFLWASVFSMQTLSSSIFSLPLFLFFAGQASREAHLHLYFKPRSAAGSCSPHQPIALGIHGKRLPWWHRLHHQERRVAEEVR